MSSKEKQQKSPNCTNKKHLIAYALKYEIRKVVLLAQLWMFQVTRDNPNPNRSKLVFVDLPAAEKLSHDFQELRLREGPTLNKGLFAVSRLVSKIANEQKPDRVIDVGSVQRFCVFYFQLFDLNIRFWFLCNVTFFR